MSEVGRHLIQSRPAVTSTSHTLPFERLSPEDFERLCLALLPHEGFESPEHYGAAGGDRGRDIVARRDGDLWYVQCKRVKECGPQVLLDEIEKVRGLMEDDPYLHPAGILFVASCNVSATARDRTRKRCSELGMACEVWGHTDLDARLQPHPGVIERFFGLRQQTPPLAGHDHLLAEYRRRVLDETEFVNLTGIPLPRERDGRPVPLRVPLDKVYIRIQALPEEQRLAEEEVELRALDDRMTMFLHTSTEAHTPGPILSDVLTTLRTLGEYLYRRGEAYRTEERPEPTDPEAALDEHHRLVILGAPGAGKSTMLRYLARRAAESPAAPLPILISLRDYATALGHNPTLSLRDFALDWAAAGNDRLRQVLTRIVEDGEALWLVDALDEARGWRVEAARQAAQLPGDLVLTSRPVGYERSVLGRYVHFETLPLSSEDIDRFLADWFGVLADQRGMDGTWIDQRMDWLKAQLETRPRIQPLTRNPLLLTFLVVLAGEDPMRKLPVHRAELYRRYVEELLDTWEVYRRPRAGTAGEPLLRLGLLEGAEARQAALRDFYQLGWHLHLAYHGGRADFLPTRAALAGALTTDLGAEQISPRKIARTLAEETIGFWEEAGMLDCWRLEQQEYLAFHHLTFQEYAAAHCLAQAWEEQPDRVWCFLRRRLHHYAWREPVILMTAMLKDTTSLVHRILRAHSPYERQLHRDLCLAADVIGETPQRVAPTLVAEIARRLSWLLSPPRIHLHWVILGALYVGGLVPD